MQQWTFNSILKNIIKRTAFGKAFTKEELNSNPHLTAQYRYTSFRKRNAVRTSTAVFRTQPYRINGNLHTYQSKSNQ
jgi:hypothetical protein